MPIQKCLVECNCILCICFIQQKETNCLINSSNKYMKAVKTCCQIKSASINCITQCEGRRCIFKILTIHKQSSQSNSHHQIKSTNIFFVVFESMFRSICRKIRSQQNQSVCFRKTCPMERNNSQRGPRHSLLNCRHKRGIHKSPLKTNKKHCFRPNKQKHSLMKPIFDLARMKT